MTFRLFLASFPRFEPAMTFLEGDAMVVGIVEARDMGAAFVEFPKGF